MTDSPIEIPQDLRDMSERSLKQAHAGYENLTDFVTKAMGIWMGVMPANSLATRFQMFNEPPRRPARRLRTSTTDILGDRIVRHSSATVWPPT